MTNEERCERARCAMQTYIGKDLFDPQAHVSDLICDLLHYARKFDIEIDSVLRSALNNYVTECINPDDSISLRVSTTIDFV